MSGRILVIDDDASVRMSFRVYLEDNGYLVQTAEHGSQGLAYFRAGTTDLVLVDLRMPEVDGLEVLATVRQESPETPVIVVSGAGTLSDSVEALRLGAWDYFIKPIQDMEVLTHAISRALEKSRLYAENRQYREHLEELVAERTRELELKTEAAGRTAEKLRIFSHVVEQSATAVMITSREGRIEYVNRKFSDITGYSSQEVVGQNPRILNSNLTPSETYADLWSNITAGRVWQGELMNRRKDGCSYWEHITITPITSDDQQITHFLAVLEDITDRKEYESQLLHKANHDSLTGLPNRVLALDRLEQALARCRREHNRGVLMYLDLDGFKAINDNHGHETGDKVLVAVSSRLQDCVRETDTIARIGGDEFLVVLQDLESESASANLADKIHGAFVPPIVIGENRFTVTVSIGIAYFPDDGEESRVLMVNADKAMYRAKQAGQNQSRYFSDLQAARDPLLAGKNFGK
jgi:diguanylate cyclase (GGDEF)-like protein/PAS domain S-box-containing protein